MNWTLMPSSKTIKKQITVSKNKFSLEKKIYPAREKMTNYGTDGPYWEIFPHGLPHASVCVQETKINLNKMIEKKFINKKEKTMVDQTLPEIEIVNQIKQVGEKGRKITIK